MSLYNVADIRYLSKSLGKQSYCSVLVPNNYSPPYSSIYLLHGNSDDHKQWLNATSIAHKDIGPTIIVLPNGDRGRYVNSLLGLYEDHILELVDLVDNWFQTNQHREHRGIGGFSMGGYGSMMLGLKHSDRFSAISTHAGSYDHEGWVIREESWYNNHPAKSILSPICSHSNYDCRRLAERLLKQEKSISIRMDCGLQDERYISARHLKKHFDQIGLDAVHEEYEGGHTWDYVDARLGEAFEFFKKHLV